jgi:hypothetical protein
MGSILPYALDLVTVVVARAGERADLPGAAPADRALLVLEQIRVPR